MSVIIKLVQQAAITSGGPTQDYVSSAFSALEPVKAAIVFSAPSTAAGTPLDHARFSIGFTDGTNHRCVSIRSRDNQTTTSTQRISLDTTIYWVMAATSTAVAGQMDFSSFGVDRLVGTWSTFPPAQWLINTVLIGGDDVSAKVGTFTCNGSQNGTVDVTDVGFEYDVLFIISRGAVTAFDETATTNAIINLSIVTYEGGTIKQVCLSFTDETALGAPNSSVSTELEDDRCLRGFTLAPPTEGASAEVTARLSNGFTVTTRDAGLAFVAGYLALKFNNATHGFSLHTRDSRTSTGTDDFTTPGYLPQAVFGLFSHLTALNTVDAGTDGGAFGFGVATGTSEEASSAYLSEDNVGTSNTKALTSDKFLDLPTGAGGAGLVADVSAFDTSGVDLNYTTVLGSARKQAYLVIGKSKVLGTSKTTGSGLLSNASRAKKMMTGASIAEALISTIATVTVSGGNTVDGESRSIAKALTTNAARIRKEGQGQATGYAAELFTSNKRSEAVLSSIASSKETNESRKYSRIESKAISSSTSNSEAQKTAGLISTNIAASLISSEASKTANAESKVVSSSINKSESLKRARLESEDISSASSKLEATRRVTLDSKNIISSLSKLEAQKKARILASSVSNSLESVRLNKRAIAFLASLGGALEVLSIYRHQQLEGRSVANSSTSNAARLRSQLVASSINSAEESLVGLKRSRIESSSISSSNTSNIATKRSRIVGAVIAAAGTSNVARKRLGAFIADIGSGVTTFLGGTLNLLVTALEGKTISTAFLKATANVRKMLVTNSISTALESSQPSKRANAVIANISTAKPSLVARNRLGAESKQSGRSYLSMPVYKRFTGESRNIASSNTSNASRLRAGLASNTINSSKGSVESRKVSRIASAVIAASNAQGSILSRIKAFISTIAGSTSFIAPITPRVVVPKVIRVKRSIETTSIIRDAETVSVSRETEVFNVTE